MISRFPIFTTRRRQSHGLMGRSVRRTSSVTMPTASSSIAAGSTKAAQLRLARSVGGLFHSGAANRQARGRSLANRRRAVALPLSRPLGLGIIRTRRGETRRFRGAGFLARRLVADALPARDPAAVVPLNGVSLHAASLSWADGDTAWTDANCGVGVIPATVPTIIGGVVDMQPGLHIDLGHLDALGLGRSGERGSRQHRCCHDKSDFHHGESSLAPIIDFVWRSLLLLVFRSHQSNATPIRRAFRQTT